MDANQIKVGQTISTEQLDSLGEIPIGGVVSDKDFDRLTDSVQVGQTISENDLNETMTTGDKSSGWLREYASNTASAASRAAGVGLGVMNSPLAMIWGSMNAKNIDPEEFKKMPYWKQEAYSVGKGFESAWNAISKKGDWGTMYGEYYKGTTGRTIADDLPDKLKWSAPTLEFLANLVSDPLIPVGQAGRIASLRMTPGAKAFNKNIPKGVLAELQKFDQLQAAEKKVLQNRLMEVLKGRSDYIKWWNDQIKAHPELLKEPPSVGSPLYPQAKSKAVVPDLTAPRSAIAGQPKKDFAIVRKTAIEKPEEFTRLTRAAKTKPKPSIGKWKLEQAVSRFNESRKRQGLDPLPLEDFEKAAKTRTQIKIERINEFRVSKGLKPISETSFTVGAARYSNTPIVKATGGLIAGVEEDEDGNITYNVKKGLAGSLAVAGGMKVLGSRGVKKFAETMGANPAWAKVHSMIGKEKKGLEFSGLLPRLNEVLFDRFGKLKKISPATYEDARKFSSYKDVAASEFDELKQVMKPVRNDEVIVTDYIDSHRAMSRADRGLKNPNGVTAADARAAIAEIENHYKSIGKDPKLLQDVMKGFQAWTHSKILKPAFDNGIISKKSYDAIVRNNEWYAAFDVLEKLPADIHKIPTGIGGEYFSVANQNFIKSMVGTEKKIANPIEATVKKFISAKATIAKNNVASTFVDDQNTAKYLRPVATSKKEFGIMRNKGLDPIMQGSWDKRKFDTINRFKDGHVERYLTDKVIADAMKQLTPYQAPRVIQALNAIFRKSATTLYVPFTISNAMRDALMSYTVATVHKTLRPGRYAKDWAKGFWEGAKHEFLGKSDLATEYIGHGGGFGYVGTLRKIKQAKADLFKKGVLGKTVDIIKSPFDLIEKISATVELAPRLGTFNRGLKSGMAVGDSALMARQSTIDFSRGGTWTKVVNQFVPFLNARVQGRVTYANALKNDPKATLSKTFVSAVLPGVGAYAWNRLYFSDLYDDIPEYIKQNYFTIIYGSDKNEHGKKVPKYFVIAKGDLGQIAFNPIEFGLDQMLKKHPANTKEFMVAYLSDLSPVEFARQGEVSLSKAGGSLLPPIVKGFVEDWANLKFYHGAEIVPYYMGKSKPPELQYKANTPESYKWLGKKIGVSPLRLQNFAGNVLAGYGREGLDPSAMLRGLTGRIVKTRGGEIENQAWTTIADIEQGYLYTRAYAEELISNDDRRAAIKLINEWNKGLNSRIKEYNEKFRKHKLHDRGGIRRSYTFSSEKMKDLLGAQKKRGSPIEQRLNLN